MRICVRYLPLLALTLLISDPALAAGGLDKIGYPDTSSGQYCKNGKLCHKQIIWVVNNTMPGYCLSYINNPLTDFKMPTYVGDPNDETGKWVE